MYFLRILGGAVLEGPTGAVTGRASQRRQLGVLAALAMARGRPVSRDRIIGLLWPETDTDRARRLLSDAVYLLRRELGEDAIAGSGDDLRLDPLRVRSDVAAFEEALEVGDFAAAAAAYGGPLLDGVYWDGAAEWERHVAAERDRLTRGYARSLENLAARAAAAGDVTAAADLWRRRAAVDPLDSRVCLSLMQALAEAGDRAGALQHARVHAALLREELGLEPDASVTRLADRLHEEDIVPAGAREREEPASFATHAVAAPGAAVAHGAAVAPAHPAGDTGAARQGRRLRSVVRPVFMGALLLMVVATVWLAVRPAAPATSPDRLMVLPFATLGSDRVTYLGEGIVDLLSVTLDGAGSLRTVDPRAVLYHARQSGAPPLAPRAARTLASSLGAGMYLTGTVTEAGPRIRISATLYATDEANIGSATVEGPVDELFELIDGLAAELLALHARRPGSRLEHLAARTTSSMPALREYLAAEALFRRRAASWEPEVVEAFSRAAALDSTFALAHYRLSVAASWVGDPVLSQRAAEQAMRHAQRLGRRERDLLDAWNARLAGNAIAAEQHYRSLLERYPDDVEASWQLAELLMQSAPFRGDSVTAAADAYRRVLDLDPTHGCARCSLIFIALQRGDMAAAESIASGLPDRGATAAPGFRLLRSLEHGDSAAHRLIVRELAREPLWTAHEAHFRVRMKGRHPAVAADLGRLVDQPQHPAEWRGLTRTLLADDLLAAGRPGAARAVVAQTAELEPGWSLILEVLFALSPVAPLTADGRAGLLSRVEAWNPDTTPPSRGYFTASHNHINREIRLYLLGLLHAAQGRPGRAEENARQLDAMNSGVARYLAAGVRSWLGPDEEALRTLEARAGMLPAQHVWLSPVLAAPLERFRHAELLAMSGRTGEALRLLAAFGQNPWDMSYLAPAALLSAELLERSGHVLESIERRGRAAELWRHADPTLRQIVTPAAAGPVPRPQSTRPAR